MSPVWTPPWDLLQMPDLWRDSGHLKQEGTSKLADWLILKLKVL